MEVSTSEIRRIRSQVKLKEKLFLTNDMPCRWWLYVQCDSKLKLGVLLSNSMNQSPGHLAIVAHIALYGLLDYDPHGFSWYLRC